MKWRFLGNLGLDDGVWIAKHLLRKIRKQLVSSINRHQIAQLSLPKWSKRAKITYLMKQAMNITKAIPISSTAYQNSVTHCAIVRSVSWFNSKFFSLTRGPSASTFRHFKNTSQYPKIRYACNTWLVMRGMHGLKLIISPSAKML